MGARAIWPQGLGPFLDLFKYGLSSALALAIDYGLLIVLTERVGLHYAASAAIGFCAGVLVTYTLSVTFVFKQRRVLSTRLEFAGFLAIGVLGLGINQALLWALVTYSPLPYSLAKAPTAVVVFLFNFAARRALLFPAVA
jgi:putative flippase GtrA